MRFLEQLVPGPERGWLALVVVAQVTVVVLAAAAVARSILRRRAAVRHRVWLCALACVLVGPVVVATAGPAGLALAVVPWPGGDAAPGLAVVVAVADLGPPPLPSALDRGPGGEGPGHPAPAGPPGEDAPVAPAVVVAVPGPAGPIVEGNAGVGAGPGPDPAPGPRGRVAGWRALAGALVLAWPAGVMIGLVRLVVGWRRLAGLSRSLAPLDEGRYRDTLGAVRQALGVGRLPPVRCSAAVAGPVAVGVLRPRVVLPVGLPEALTPGQLRDVLVHECAHALRRDPLVGVLQRLAAILYWPHPLVHYLNAQLARSREEVCDNFVLRCGDPCGYARTLLELTERCRPPYAVGVGVRLMDSRWTLRDRIAGLLDPRRDAMTKPGPWAAATVILVLAATCVATGLVRPSVRAAAGGAPEGAAGVDNEQGPPAAAAVVRAPAETGLSVEKAPAGERPIAGALVEITHLGRGGARGHAVVADEKGRFHLSIDPGRALIIYTRNPEGTLAGFTRIEADPIEVRAEATPASRIFGKVVDTRGKPVPERPVQLRLDSGPEYAASGHYYQRVTTDAEGRYEFRGMAVGAIAELTAYHNRGFGSGGPAEDRRVEVRGPDPIEVPDIVIPVVAGGGREAPTRAGSPEIDRPLIEAAVASSSRPVAPTRAEVEAFVRELGRDPVTPELVDRAWVLTRPQFTWSVDLDHVRRRLTAGDFLARVDRASRSALGKPADTLAILRTALRHHVGRDVESLKWFLGDAPPEAGTPVRLVHGTVADSATGRPISGALVYTADALIRTDAAGAFEIRPGKVPRQGMIWVEADGYALAEYPALAEGGDSANARIKLVRHEPIAGRVSGPDGGPVSGAVVLAWFNHYDFRVPRPPGPPRKDSFGVPLEVRTDPDGRFVFRGVPPGVECRAFQVRHPEYRTLKGPGLPLKGGQFRTLTLRPGCKVAGIVVDEQGRPVPDALVEIRPRGTLQDELSTYTGDDGRFRFGNASPGLRTILVKPERHAATHVGVIVTEDRPVENQFLVGPGAYISGKVVGPDGEPVARAAVGWVWPIDDRGNAVEALELGRMTSTAEDGTFRLGPLPQGSFSLTSVIEGPRRIGRTNARANQADAVIRLEPDERTRAGR